MLKLHIQIHAGTHLHAHRHTHTHTHARSRTFAAVMCDICCGTAEMGKGKGGEECCQCLFAYVLFPTCANNDPQTHPKPFQCLPPPLSLSAALLPPLLLPSHTLSLLPTAFFLCSLVAFVVAAYLLQRLFAMPRCHCVAVGVEVGQAECGRGGGWCR